MYEANPNCSLCGGTGIAYHLSFRCDGGIRRLSGLCPSCELFAAIGREWMCEAREEE